MAGSPSSSLPKTLTCTIQSIGHNTVYENVRHIDLTALDGQLRIYPGHIALITALAEGPAALFLEGSDPEDPLAYLLFGGVARIDQKSVTIITPEATLVEDEDNAPPFTTAYTWDHDDAVFKKPSL